jgi:hypothetical protein
MATVTSAEFVDERLDTGLSPMQESIVLIA